MELILLAVGVLSVQAVLIVAWLRPRALSTFGKTRATRVRGLIAMGGAALLLLADVSSLRRWQEALL